MVSLLGQPSPTTRAVEGIICRTDPNILLKPNHFVELLLNDPDLRTQRALSHAVHTILADQLHQTMLNRGDTDCGDADLIAHCSKDDRQLVLVAPLSDKFNRLPADDFIPWMRMFLQLPPLCRIGNASE